MFNNPDAENRKISTLIVLTLVQTVFTNPIVKV